jgi:5-formyltetrahydrofolate cyclo-ligase
VKKELRARLHAVLAAIPSHVIAARSQQAATLLFQQPEYQRAEIVMVYLSLPQEADTTAIVLQAWRDRKRVLAPQVSWDSHAMIPLEIRNLDTDVASTDYGLRVPVNGLPFPVELIDLVIVPGLGFDPAGNRLGRGRGFYDRFLNRPEFKGRACALALEEQVVDSIPATEHDRKVDMLVTDQQVRRFQIAPGPSPRSPGTPALPHDPR